MYELREGMRMGVMHSAVHSTVQGGHFGGQDSTLIKVELDPFGDWYLPSGQDPRVKVQLGPSGKQTELVHFAPGTSGPSPTFGYLEVLGRIDQADIDAGKWYYIDGTQEKPEATQTGQWLNATNSGGVTTFTVDEFANLAEEMEG